MTRSVLPSRLPGVGFLEPPPGAPSALPPLDVAAFVGFAERGPLDLPVPLDDVTQYSEILGGELPLARGDRGQTIAAHLPAAVRSFFANGGRRCYVVRVAGPAATAARFVLPGIVVLDDRRRPGHAVGNPRRALVDASSEGRWANRLRMATRLSVLPLPREAFEIRDTGLLWSAGSDPFAIERGDVLRLTDDTGDQWLAPVTEVRRPARTGERVTIQAPAVYALVQIAASPTAIVGSVSRLGPDGAIPLAVTGTAHLDRRAGGEDEETVLEVHGPDVAELRLGDLLEISLPEGSAIIHLAELRQLGEAGSPPERHADVRGGRLLRIPAGPLPHRSPPDWRRVERLRFDLLLEIGETRQPTLTDLAFSQGGPRFWGDVVLLESSAGLGRSASGGQSGPAAMSRTKTVDRSLDANRSSGASRAIAAARAFRAFRQGHHLDSRERRSLDRVALGGLLAPVDEAPPDEGVGDPAQLTFLPLDVPIILAEEDFRGPWSAGDDDLSAPVVDPFLDDGLRRVSTGRLLSEAWDQAYVQERRLRGLHSLMTVDEVALVAVPDAVHRPWAVVTSPPAPELQPPLPLPPAEEPCPDLVSPFLACDRPPTIESVTPPIGETAGTTPVTITGSGFAAGPPTVLIGKRAAGDVVVENDGRLTCFAPSSGLAGPVAVEVTNRHGTAILPDSFTYVAASTLADLPELLPVGAFDLDSAGSPLLALHEAVLRICQARRDLVGLLSLPAHFERQDCLEWQDAFRARLGLPHRGQASDLPDLADLSFVAIYHPWLLLADGSTPERVRLVPPDGAVAGMIAARERRRGVWVAPANVPLQAALAVVPDLSRDDWAALFAAQINVLRREARDVRAMSAHTLSDDHELLQLSVRRLMILLRKAAVERGMDFVFESNHERFREGVAVMLRGMLRGLFDRGAFAGATTDQSYRVVTDASVNPRQSVDQGRFVALVQVAPSQPAELITVALTRSDEGALQVNEV